MSKYITADKSQYRVGDEVALLSGWPLSGLVEIFHQGKVVKTINADESVERFSLGEFPVGGYWVKTEVGSTAFDVVEDLNKYVRYGFLSDFNPADCEDRSDVVQMNRYHITSVQFYDWMYRHHQLIPNTDVFKDALDRPVYLPAVRSKIELCHEFGMKAIAYGAIYGAEEEYFSVHPDQMLYKDKNTKYDLIDIIAIMNTEPDCSWTKHMIREFADAIRVMDFDGIHMDQYGFPKYAKTRDGRVVDVGGTFAPFIDEAKLAVNEVKTSNQMFFNCVNNWPIERVADSLMDAVYIEVWDPHSTYRHLHQLVRESRMLTADKPIVLSAYIHPFNQDVSEEEKETAALLTMATIFSSGGTHLLLGETDGALAEAYYVNHGKYQESFRDELARYYDCITAYEEWLLDPSVVDLTGYFVGGINEELMVKNYPYSGEYAPEKIHVQLTRNQDSFMVQLVNMLGVKDDTWNAPHMRPLVAENVEVELMIHEKIKSIVLVSPDTDLEPVELDFSYVEHSQGKALRFVVPSLEIWDIVMINV
jgi:dextranase